MTSKNEEKRTTKTHLSRNKSEITDISTSLSTTFAPVDKTKSVLRLSRHAKSVNKASGEYRLLEAIGAALSIKAGQNQADGRKIVSRTAEGVDKLTKLGTLLGGRLASLNPIKQT